VLCFVSQEDRGQETAESRENVFSGGLQENIAFSFSLRAVEEGCSCQ
jgi:hypothetical protein